MRKTEETIALLEATLEASLDGILVLDLSDRVVRCNQRFLHMFGLRARQVAGQRGDAVLALLRQQTQAISCSSPEDLFATLDGLIVERCSAPVTGEDGAVGHLDIYRDVTEWRSRVETADWERALLDTAQEIAHAGSWTWEATSDEGSMRCSAEACRILGIPADHPPATPDAFLNFVYPDDRDAVRRATAAACAAGDSHEIEHRIVRHDRELRWVHVKARVLRDDRGAALRMVGAVQDITQRRALEEQLRQSQKLEAIGRLAGGVAHDLNNALTAIVGYTELALSALNQGHPAWADVQEIRRAAERAESVTRQLLAFSRKQRVQPRVFNLGKSIESLSRMLKRLLGTGIEMTTVIDKNLPPIYGDPGQIQQALINLAVNARDAMEAGGRLHVRIKIARIDDVFARTHAPMPAGKYVELSVSDTGAGMTLETQAHIFEPFFTTKDIGKGTGLGLPMVYGTVKQSGGFVFVESAPGRGSTFRVYFPPAADEPTLEGMAAAEPATILVAEDETAVRTLVVAALTSEGYCLLQAESGAEALKLAARHNGPIDLLLTDANMPGMTGVELANELVRRRGSLRVVIMSGYTVESLRVSGLEQPPSFLPKPFTPRDLRQTVRDVLAREA